MLTATYFQGYPAPAWAYRLDQAARRMAGDVLSCLPDEDRQIRAAEFVLGMAHLAVQPEVRAKGMTRLDDGNEVEIITGPGILRLAFENEVGDWSRPDTAGWIKSVVLAAVTTELGVDPALIEARRVHYGFA